MSADNGVYILETKGPEYRVIHAQAIDNIAWNGDEYWDGEWNSKCIQEYFGKAEKFNNLDEAYKEAVKIHNQYEWTEYGICVLPYPEKKFPEYTEKK